MRREGGWGHPWAGAFQLQTSDVFRTSRGRPSSLVPRGRYAVFEVTPAALAGRVLEACDSARRDSGGTAEDQYLAHPVVGKSQILRLSAREGGTVREQYQGIVHPSDRAASQCVCPIVAGR